MEKAALRKKEAVIEREKSAERRHKAAARREEAVVEREERLARTEEGLESQCLWRELQAPRMMEARPAPWSTVYLPLYLPS